AAREVIERAARISGRVCHEVERIPRQLREVEDLLGIEVRRQCARLRLDQRRFGRGHGDRLGGGADFEGGLDFGFEAGLDDHRLEDLVREPLRGDCQRVRSSGQIQESTYAVRLCCGVTQIVGCEILDFKGCARNGGAGRVDCGNGQVTAGGRGLPPSRCDSDEDTTDGESEAYARVYFQQLNLQSN